MSDLHAETAPQRADSAESDVRYLTESLREVSGAIDAVIPVFLQGDVLGGLEGLRRVRDDLRMLCEDTPTPGVTRGGGDLEF